MAMLALHSLQTWCGRT